MTSVWRGIFPAVTTQFREDGSLDLEGTAAHLDRLIDDGVHGLIMLGTLGENVSLDPAEKSDVLKAAVERVDGRVPVLAGVAEASTGRACRFAAEAQEAGARGLMVLPGIGYHSDRRETVAHFRAVARASDLPIMVYNNPITYGVDVTPEILDELADDPKMVAVKESSGDTRRITDIKNRCGGRYSLFVGVDDLVLESLMLGASGWVAGLVNAFPAESRQLWDLAQSGRWAEAVALYRWFMPLLHLDVHVKLIQYIKLAAQECGIGSEYVRAPRLPLEGEERARVLAVIREGIAGRPNPFKAS